MHVLILAQYFPPDLGGSSTRAYNVARGLVLNGVETTVITAFPHYPHGDIPSEYHGKPYTVEHVDGIKVIRTYMVPLESKGLLFRLATFMTFIASSLLGLLKVRDVDAVWVANPDVFCIIPGLIYRALFRCPLIFNVDDLSVEDVSNLDIMTEESLLYKIVRAFSGFLYRRVDAVTPISPGYFKGISKFGVSPDKIYLVRSGVDLDTFKASQSSGKNSRFTVAYSGSFSVAYDFSQILDAAELLSGRDVEFLIQGKGELGPWMIGEVRKRGIGNVRVINRITVRAEVAEFLGYADALILPLKDFGVPYPGISSKLYEYQALAKPIICCSEGNSATYVEETGSGLIVRPGDHHGIADAVLYLMDNPIDAERLGSSGKSYVEENVALDRIGAQMHCVILELLREDQENNLNDCAYPLIENEQAMSLTTDH